jgi:hypothetical protein
MKLKAGDIVLIAADCCYRPGKKAVVVSAYHGLHPGWLVKFPDGKEVAIWARHVA